MTASREITPQRLFLRMMGGIVLTGMGPILLVLVLLLHVGTANHGFADSPAGVLRVRMLAFCLIAIGLPIWFFHQLRLARGIRDGKWRDSELTPIRRVVFAPSIRLMGLLTLLAYAIGICVRGRVYWLVGFGVLVFPLGAFGDLYKQFILRQDKPETANADSAAAPVLPTATVH